MAGENMQIFEKDFQSVTKVVLGKALSNHFDYERWLLQNVAPPVEQKSAVSGKSMWTPSYPYYTDASKNAVLLDEAWVEGEKKLSMQEVEKLSVANAKNSLKKISKYSPDVMFGANVNMVKCGVYFWSSNCYMGTWMGKCKNSSYCFWPRNSEYCIGSHFTFSCKFALKCYNSVNLSRCFEVSHSSDCSDCYFCHNCQNMRDSMFCSNAKGLHYAIANRVVGQAEYDRVKKIVLGEVAAKLEKDKKLDLNIFNLGCNGHK
ncbi:hypothetical protein COU37_02115 [Candidatus Micrarchaeota archaeon CG10_big_fil_rev_8_21_14_0_10_45_29]|nr:MAG: hypothetical protein COU37_02115 [Candidatus Micrarchaeota archaeon CG10_big_fil_rev_8_21_14_0_10_45_29]